MNDAQNDENDDAPRHDNPWRRSQKIDPAYSPDAPPRRMTFRGAPATVALIVFMTLLELAIYLGGRIAGVAQGVMGPNQLREHIIYQYSFVPAELFLAPTYWGVVTVFTSILLHGGLLHLGANMMAMAALSPPTERRMGQSRYLLLFAAAGALGCVAHGAWQYVTSLFSVYTVADLMGLPLVGASGAISGLLGAELRARQGVLLRIPEEFRRIDPTKYLINASTGFVVVNVMITLMGSFISGAAHLGGFAAGLLLAPLLFRDVTRK